MEAALELWDRQMVAQRAYDDAVRRRYDAGVRWERRREQLTMVALVAGLVLVVCTLTMVFLAVLAVALCALMVVLVVCWVL